MNNLTLLFLALNFFAFNNKVGPTNLIRFDKLHHNLFSSQSLININKPNDTNFIWRYEYPFKDKAYVLAIQSFRDNFNQATEDLNSTVYFWKMNGTVKRLIWQENLFIQNQLLELNYEDFNADGVKDLLIFSTTGARGANSFYYLFLVNPKTHTLTKVKGFEQIVNPSFDAKHKVICSYGFSGSNYYSIHRISKTNKVYNIGKAFKDFEGMDNIALDNKIEQILKANKQ